MQIKTFVTKPLIPPKDSLLEKIKNSKLSLKEGDVLCITSKVVSIDEGRCLKIDKIKSKDTLAISEAEMYLPREKTPFGHALHTITKGILIRTAGIDESNGDGHYILWPKDPMKSAKKLHKLLCKNYKIKNLGIIITDSISHPLRRGVSGFALSFYGFSPLKDYRGEKDIFDRTIQTSVANIADALASAAVLVMGEGGEQTPIARIRGLKNIVPGKLPKKPWNSFTVSPEEDIFAPFFNGVRWKRGGGEN